MDQRLYSPYIYFCSVCNSTSRVGMIGSTIDTSCNKIRISTTALHFARQTGSKQQTFIAIPQQVTPSRADDSPDITLNAIFLNAIYLSDWIHRYTSNEEETTKIAIFDCCCDCSCVYHDYHDIFDPIN